MEPTSRRQHSMRSRTRPKLAMLCLAVALASAGCARVAGQGDFLIKGSLVDAETGAPVAHRGLYVHVFNDASDHQTSVGPEPMDGFKVRMPSPAVRLRVVDTTDQYERHEEQLVVPKEGLAHVVRLVPTHYVLLKARVVVEEGGAWIPLPPPERSGGGGHIIGDTPFIIFALDSESPERWSSPYRSGAKFELRVPRARLDVGALNSERQPDQPSLDLTGVTGDVVEREIRLVIRP